MKTITKLKELEFNFIITFFCLQEKEMENFAFAEPHQKNFSPSTEAASRPVVHFHPSLWGDRFLNYNPPPQDTLLQWKQEFDRLKEEVRKKLSMESCDPKKGIVYIDALERLGLGYHFEGEIEDILQRLSDKFGQYDAPYENDLHYTSLGFRILRQHGFFVSCDVFEKFKGQGGRFKESTKRDVQAILNLYEASYLRMHDEKILDEAMEFTTTQLKSLAGELNGLMATQATQALKMPLHRGIPRLLSRYYIDIYEGNPNHDKTLLRFAKIDFNLLQVSHAKELQKLCRWWKSIGLSQKLPFARDRIVESYFWALGAFYETQYALGREIFGKIVQTMTITDDTYDAYGLFEELQLYTEAIYRWDISSMNKLPDYMKLMYEKVLDTFDGFLQDLAEEGRSNFVLYLQELFKALCGSYSQEAKWLHEKYTPTYEEYMEHVGIATGGSPILSATALLGMKKISSQMAFDWISLTPKPIKASSLIGRLLNDIIGYKKENHIPSAVECFMAQYDVSKDKAVEELYDKVEEAWKDLNEEILKPTKIPRALLNVILNLARFSEGVYRSEDDEFTIVNQSMQRKIQALFVDPVSF